LDPDYFAKLQVGALKIPGKTRQVENSKQQDLHMRSGVSENTPATAFMLPDLVAASLLWCL